MQDDGAIREALHRARAAVDAATRALRHAEAAAREAGVELPEPEESISARRVDIVERDGTIRVALGDSALSRQLPLRGEDHPHPGRGDAAGILFVDDNGTESGALVHAGRSNDGDPESFHRLSFDDHEQNEALVIGRTQRGDTKAQFIDFFDQPDWSIVDLVRAMDEMSPDDLESVRRKHYAAPTFIPRMHLGREEDGSVGLALHDASGRPRIRLVVEADGQADVQVIDDDGAVRSLATGDAQ